MATVLLSVALVSASCTRAPVVAPRAVVPETVSSQVRVAAASGKVFGHMIALGVGVSSGTSETYTASASRIYAVDTAGNRIAPLNVAEAARQAGGAEALYAGLEGAGAGALLTSVLGAATGALIGAAQGGGAGAGKGAAIGAGVGVAAGAIGGFYESKSETERQIVEQLHGLYFGEQTLKTGVPVSGFVFYPEDHYVGVRAVLIDVETGRATEVAGSMVSSEH